MNIDQLIKKIELSFESLLGLSIHGLLGIIVGLTIFSLLLFLIKYERKIDRSFNFQADNLSEVGNPIEANINLARSLIEMQEIQKAKDCLNQVETEKDLTEEQRNKIEILKDRMKEKEDGVFPGSPFIFVGFNENLGWGFTVNKPDLSDSFLLKVNPEDDNEYWLDGKWVPFKKKNLKLPIKLWGPFWWTFNRETKYSIHGPVLETDHGIYAIRFSGMEDIKQVEQWYRLNKSKNKKDWLDAMKLRSIVSFNAVYADKESNIIFLHNSSSPNRKEGIDWTQPVDGTKSSLVWNEIVPLKGIPLLINPKSGWLISTNQDPFKVTSEESNLSPSDYSSTLGLQTRMTNRANRGLELFSETEYVSEEKFKKIKFDNSYSRNSRAYKYLEQIFEINFEEKDLIDAQRIVKDWDLKTDFNNRSAALGVCTISPEWLAEQRQRSPPPVETVFRECVEQINKIYGRLDPLWSERNFLVRGNKKISVQGGPDTLRAIYGRQQKEGYLKAQGGDGLYIYVEWNKNGNLKSESIHQYGSATQDSSSPHFDDQMDLYAAEKLKDTFFSTFNEDENVESRITIPLPEDS